MWEFTGGLPETRCGFGSKVESTAKVREWLPQLFKALQVYSVLDAPCGDFNWMAHVDLSGINYIGVDSESEMVQAATEKSSEPGKAPSSKIIVCADLLGWPLPVPVCDLIICRDFLQHLPTVDAQHVTLAFMATGARYIAATCHSNSSNGDIVRRGDFRPLNLCRPPFNWPDPLHAVSDGDNRALGLWAL